ncbi:MAG: sugar-transfer associated ATP-grasp domain-containing protein [Erysipelotrichaceae bacterium]|nr:sugar-transfer associated ATP-grasp domain-containing protein [Erysipelotrichaceae bacterium]
MSSILNRFELSSFQRLFNNANQVHKYSGKNTLLILIDMGICILRDKVGYMEYNLFNFVNKPQSKRDTYVTFEYSQYLFKTLNNKEYIDIFNDKLQFNKIFLPIMGREFIDIAESSYEDFVRYCEDKKKIFCKPADSCSGKGIYKSIDIDESTDLKELYDFFKENKLYVEDTIIQHPKMSSLHPESINTIRITTLVNSDGPHIMYALLRIGTDHRMVDNVASGGIYTVLSDNGKIVNPCWSDKTITTYTKHPTTNVDMIGFEIPYFKEAIELCKKAAMIKPEVAYVGWDVAITEKGPVIVEGNPLPGYDMPQNYFASGKDEGLKPKFEELLKNR